MQLTGSTRLAWERDVALNRQGLFAVKLNEQQKAVEKAVEETRLELEGKYKPELEQERQRVENLESRSMYFEEAFRDSNKVNKTLADTNSELLDELEKERRESASKTPKKVRQSQEKMRKRNKELHTELEELRATCYDQESEIKDLKKDLTAKTKI